VGIICTFDRAIMIDIAARAAHYRRKAEEVRAIANATPDMESRRILLTVATDYDMLARSVEHTHTPDPIPASE
jgi:hypothetical protein